MSELDGEIIISQYEVTNYENYPNPQEAKVHSVIKYCKDYIGGKKKDGENNKIALQLINELTAKGEIEGSVVGLIRSFIDSKINLSPSEFLLLTAVGASPKNELPSDYLSKYMPNSLPGQLIFSLRAAMNGMISPDGKSYRLINIVGDDKYASNLSKWYKEFGDPDEYYRLFGSLLRIETVDFQEAENPHTFVSRVFDYKKLFSKLREGKTQFMTDDDFENIMNSTKKTNQGVIYPALTGKYRLFFLLGMTGYANTLDPRYEKDARYINEYFAIAKYGAPNSVEHKSTTGNEIKGIRKFIRDTIMSIQSNDGTNYDKNYLNQIPFLRDRFLSNL